ncbi:Kinesin light chain [Paramyrothecium foliicola]|nr:Kinesin light chain [Paramyrothecium foliicola]
MTSPPHHDKIFKTAMICALPLEYDAVSLIFDEIWDEEDSHSGYMIGRIGQLPVVLALLSGMVKASAAGTAARIRSKCWNIQLALVYDFGRKYPDRFISKDGPENHINTPNKNVRHVLNLLETSFERLRLQQKSVFFLAEPQAKAVRQKYQSIYRYPGATEDKLYTPSYRHIHRKAPACICGAWQKPSDPACEEALKSSGDVLHCEEIFLVPRNRLKRHKNEGEGFPEPSIHVGVVGSGDLVLKSGEHRDNIARPKDIIAFEMEGAGVSEELPCVIIKGVCDFADCHKNKRWQHFAAAVAASTTKAILGRYATSLVRGSTGEELLAKAHFQSPFDSNTNAASQDILPLRPFDTERPRQVGSAIPLVTELSMEEIHLISSSMRY